MQYFDIVANLEELPELFCTSDLIYKNPNIVEIPILKSRLSLSYLQMLRVSESTPHIST